MRLREASIIHVMREGVRLETPLETLRFAAGDQILIETSVAGVKGIKEMTGCFSNRKPNSKRIGERDAVLMEGILGSRSTFLGKTLRDLNFRQRYGVLILAVHRQGENLREHFEDVELAFGDTLLVQGSVEAIHRLMEERDFLSLTEPKQRAFRRHKASLAIAAISSVIVLGAFEVLPLAALALIAVIFVVLTRCLDVEEARGAIQSENPLHDFRHARARHRDGNNRRRPSHRERRDRRSRPLWTRRHALGNRTWLRRCSRS